MSYVDYYLQASKLSDRISEGEVKSVAKEPKDSGLLGRRQKKVEQEVSPHQRNQEMIMDYFRGIEELPKRSSGYEPRFPKQSPSQPSTEPVGGLQQAKAAIAKIESGGRYDAVGPVVGKGMYKGQRAIGKYQVMEGNIGPWTKEAFGKAMTPEEFKNDPQAQEALVDYRFQKAYEKYGNWDDVASVWFTGQPVSKAGNVNDGYTSNQEYLSRFRSQMKEA